MTNDPSIDYALRAALILLRTGRATQSEVAELAGTSRQLVRHWAMRHGIDCRGARNARLVALWRKLAHEDD